MPSLLSSFGILPPLRDRARRFRHRVRNRLRGETAETFFDLHDAGRVNEFLSLAGADEWPATADAASASREGATRYIVGRLIADAKLRRRYPTALSDGPTGAFAHSLATDPNLSERARANVRDAFACNPGGGVMRVYELRADLRHLFPLAFTPKQRGEYLRWLLTYGRQDMGVRPEEALWFLLEQDEQPDRGLAAAYRRHAEWQAEAPHGLTRFGWAALKTWVGRRYAFDGRWLRRAALVPRERPWDELVALLRVDPESRATFPTNPTAVPDWAARTPRVARFVTRDWLAGLAKDIEDRLPARAAVTMIGLFRYTSGLQNAAKSCVESLTSVGVRTGLRDVPVVSRREPRSREDFDAVESADVTILNTGLDISVGEAYDLGGLHRRPDVYRIGHWWWELESLPAKWLDRADGVDEIWAPTRFIADATRRAFRKPVYTMMPGLELPAFEPLSKEYFGLDPARFAFCFVFDMSSRIQRKNPLGLIEAFRQAFSPADAVELVLKVSAPESFYESQWNQLRAAVAATPNVKLVDRVLTRAEVLGLIDAADAYVSLHRSEGFGLTCAEAMLLGKPVIATNYSGNLDFMTAENSYLVDYELVPLHEAIDPYPAGGLWAEPKLDHAARLMRDVYGNRATAIEIGQRAKRELSTHLSIVAAGERMRKRLEAIRESRRG